MVLTWGCGAILPQRTTRAARRGLLRPRSCKVASVAEGRAPGILATLGDKTRGGGSIGPPGHSPKLGNGASRVAVSFDTESAKINDGASDYEVDEVWCSAPNQCGQPALRRFQPPAQALAAAGCLTGRSIVRPGGGRCFDSGRVTAYPFRPRDGVSA